MAVAGVLGSVYFNDDKLASACKSTLRFFKRNCDLSGVKKTVAVRANAEVLRRRRALEEYIARKGHVRTTWCKAAGVSESSLRWFLSGRTDSLNDRTYEKLARHDHVPVGELRGDVAVQAQIPVRSYIGAGAEVFPFDDDNAIDYVDAPPGTVEGEAFVVRGDSGMPMFQEGDILIPGTKEHDPARLQDKVVALQLRDGRRLLKRIIRGSKKGRWHLLSINPAVPALEDQQVSWVAPIPWVKRRL